MTIVGFLFYWRIVFGFQWGGSFLLISLKRCQFRQLPRSVVRISHIITSSFKTVNRAEQKKNYQHSYFIMHTCHFTLVLSACVRVCVCVFIVVGWACALHSNFCFIRLFHNFMNCKIFFSLCFICFALQASYSHTIQCVCVNVEKKMCWTLICFCLCLSIHFQWITYNKVRSENTAGIEWTANRKEV